MRSFEAGSLSYPFLAKKTMNKTIIISVLLVIGCSNIYEPKIGPLDMSGKWYVSKIGFTDTTYNKTEYYDSANACEIDMVSNSTWNEYYQTGEYVKLTKWDIWFIGDTLCRAYAGNDSGWKVGRVYKTGDSIVVDEGLVQFYWVRYRYSGFPSNWPDSIVSMQRGTLDTNRAISRYAKRNPVQTIGR